MRFIKDRGIVLVKRELLGEDKLVTFFSKHGGKVSVRAFGIKKITSRRISHLESGNYVSFTLTVGSKGKVLSETELIWGFSRIREDRYKLNNLITILSILNALLPEEQPEEAVFEETLQYLKKLYAVEESNSAPLREYLCCLLLTLGYINTDMAEKIYFDPLKEIEIITQRKFKSIL